MNESILSVTQLLASDLFAGCFENIILISPQAFQQASYGEFIGAASMFDIVQNVYGGNYDLMFQHPQKKFRCENYCLLNDELMAEWIDMKDRCDIYIYLLNSNACLCFIVRILFYKHFNPRSVYLKYLSSLPMNDWSQRCKTS